MNKTKLFKIAEKAIKNNEFTKVLELLTPIAELGDNEAQFLLGYLYFTNAEVPYLDSVSWLRKAAKQGNAKACYYLSVKVKDPYCPSLEERIKYLEKSAVLGYANAQRDIGCAYATGQKGFKKNQIKAREWYRKAAEQGEPNAQYNLGLMLLNGEGGAKNIHEGIKWLELSAENSQIKVMEAVKLLSEIYNLGLYEIPKNKNESEYWKKVQRNMMIEK